MVVRKKEGEWAGSGPPFVVVKGEGGGLDQEARVSISHDGDYATAVCLGFEPAMGTGGEEGGSG